MYKLILISICFTLFFCAAKAQEKSFIKEDTVVVQSGTKTNDINDEEAKDTIFIDTTLYYNQLHVAKDSIAAWKNAPSFEYVKYLDSLLKDKQLKQKEQSVQQQKDTSPNWFNRFLSSTVLKFFLWIIAIAFVLFILYQLFLTEGAFRKKSKLVKNILPDAAEEVITPESDFEILIRQALQTANYRLAIRYQYLQTLHKLAAKNLIALANDKTNYQYVREITNQIYQNEFAALTLNYEYVWYGEFAIEENVYSRLEKGFSLLNNKL